MTKVFLLSLLVATIAVPTLAARDRSAVRGLKKALLGVAIIGLLYWWGVQRLPPPL